MQKTKKNDLLKSLVSLALAVLMASFILLVAFTFHSKNINALAISNAYVDEKEQILESIETNLEKYEQRINAVRGFENKTVEDVKLLEDFNGEIYIDIECAPTGYAILNYKYNIILEMAVDSISPYKNVYGELIYGGPTYYYRQEATLFNASNSFNVVDLMSDAAITFNADEFHTFQAYNQSIVEKTAEVYSKGDTPTISTRSTDAFIDNYQYISGLNNFGVNVNGTCGYIAAGIVLYYNYMQFDSRFIQSDDIHPNGGIRDSLHQKLISIGQSLNIGYSTIAGDIEKVMKEYTKTCVPEATHYSMLLSTSLNIDLCFIDNKPVILFGNFVNPQGGSKVNHAVVAYGYTQYTELWFSTRYYYVHYGWSGYNMVQLLDNIFTNPIGSMYNMNPKG